MKRKEQRWSDKSAKRHKHHYIEPCIVEIVNGNSSTFHDVMKCDCCDSFIAIQHQDSWCGLLVDFHNEENLPVVVFERTKNNIGFEGIRRRKLYAKK